MMDASPPCEESLTASDRTQLIALARDSLRAALNGKPLPDLSSATSGAEDEGEAISPRLQADGAVFVSLYSGQALRGCIGTFSRIAPLWQQVQRMTLMAASEDPRFRPVRRDEPISFELSVLSKPVGIAGPEDIVIGRDGLVISDGERRGVLLPQVATKYDWEPEAFLSHTCLKAGLPADAWETGALTIEHFQADVFRG